MAILLQKCSSIRNNESQAEPITGIKMLRPIYSQSTKYRIKGVKTLK